MIRTANEPQRLADPGHSCPHLGRRLLLHRRRRPARAAADLCLAAPDHRRGRDVAFLKLQAASRSACRARCGARSCCSPCSTMRCPSPCSAGARRISPAASPRSSMRRRRSGASSSPISSPHDERMTPRKIAGVLLGFGGVATMIGPALLVEPRHRRACAARLRHRLAQLCARRRLGAPLPAHGRLADVSVTTGQLTAGALMMLPVAMLVDQPWTHAFPPLSALGRDRRAGAALHRLRLRALLPADRPRRRDQRAARHPAGSAGRDPARRPVPRRAARAAGLRRAGLIALGLAAIDGRLLSAGCGGAGFGKQLSRLGAGPVEVADVAPDLLALRVEQDRGRQHLERRARRTAPSSDPDRRRGRRSCASRGKRRPTAAAPCPG